MSSGQAWGWSLLFWARRCVGVNVLFRTFKLGFPFNLGTPTRRRLSDKPTGSITRPTPTHAHDSHTPSHLRLLESLLPMMPFQEARGPVTRNIEPRPSLISACCSCYPLHLVVFFIPILPRITHTLSLPTEDRFFSLFPKSPEHSLVDHFGPRALTPLVAKLGASNFPSH